MLRSATIYQSLAVVSSPAPAVWISGSQSGLCRPTRTREADDPERSLEGHHQSAQSSGTCQTQAVSYFEFKCSRSRPHVRLLLIFFFQDYISCAEIWVEFTCRHFTVSETQREEELFYFPSLGIGYSLLVSPSVIHRNVRSTPSSLTSSNT